ncbi:hypothetical protein WMY93_006130 [Mugilogobius chulae]|uniref:Paraneoplastic antigen Ma-like C-terminal domain-containing protein n=1 Tax=Mugilogobius chulae TaxID=88201 RepID=A0AAW0PJ70_9GOBI
MVQINDAVAELRPTETKSPTEHKMAASTELQNKMDAASAPEQGTTPSTGETGQRHPALNMSAADLNPPEIQRYVVEHIVKTDEAMHVRSSHRLRLFSGKTPRPQHEVDYDSWRSGVDIILKDTAISELQRTRQINDSLLPPAIDIVKHLSPDLPAETFIQHLDSAFGTVQDGEELYMKFMDTLQDSGEKPSAYLQRLQVALSLAVKRGGVKPSDVNRYLLSQFCRGCWDNNLIAELQLKQRKADPPSFTQLLLLLRTEEDREATKTQRMQQHLRTTSKQRVASQAQFAAEEEGGVCAALASLTKQVAEIQKQLAALSASQSTQSRQKPPQLPELLQMCLRVPSLGSVSAVEKTATSDHSTVIIEGSAKVSSPPSSQSVILQHPASTLPGGLCVSSCLITLPALPPFKVPVVVTNESEQDTFIPPLSIIGDLEAYHCILSEQRVTQHPAENPPSKLNLNFGESPLSPEWRKRVTEKLNTIADVFSQHDLDFGCTTAVKHQIPLHDPTPVKQRARPIHPQDIEAVRRHLRELLEAGVIRESTSPFSSPVVITGRKFQNCIQKRFKSADRNKTRFDRRVIPSALEPGDKVLVRNVRLRGKHKLSDKWEEGITSSSIELESCQFTKSNQKVVMDRRELASRPTPSMQFPHRQ